MMAQLRNLVARPDCPPEVRDAFFEASVGDSGVSRELILDSVTGVLPAVPPSADLLPVFGDDAAALLEAVAAADSAAEEAGRYDSPDLGSTEADDGAGQTAGDAAAAATQSQTRRAEKKKRAAPRGGSIFDRLQAPAVDPEILQRVKDEQAQQAAAAKKKREGKPPPVSSAFLDRIASNERESGSARQDNRAFIAANQAAEESQSEASSPSSMADPFIELMGGQPPRPKSAEPPTVNTVLRSPFFEVTHNASLGLAAGKPGQGPKHVEETDIIMNGGRTLHASLAEDHADRRTAVAQMVRFADCGIFSADQLAHTLVTRTTPGFQVPQVCNLRGRSVLLSELLITCCSGITLAEPVVTNVELSRYYTRMLDDSNQHTLPRGAPVVGEPGAWVGPQLALALFACQRLDLQAALLRIDATTPSQFLSLTDLEAHGDEDILALPINIRLRECGDRVLTSAGIEMIRRELVPKHPAEIPALDNCPLSGTEGVHWSAVSGSKEKGVRRSIREVHEDGSSGDVCYIPGHIPLVIGLQCGSMCDGNIDRCWNGQGNARIPRFVTLHEGGRGTVALMEGTRIVSERGDVRGTLTADLSPEDEEMRYILDDTSQRDFLANDFAFESIRIQWRKVQQGDDPVAFFRIGDSPRLDDDAAGDEDELSIIALVDAVVDRFVETMGGCPHIVLCRLDLDKVGCSNPLSAAVKGLQGPAILRARAAWQNYHALIEVAKKRMTGVTGEINASGKHKPAKRGGCGLFVELHAMPSDAAACDGPIQLGYGLRPCKCTSNPHHDLISGEISERCMWLQTKCARLSRGSSLRGVG